jgi:hypothetical protein
VKNQFLENCTIISMNSKNFGKFDSEAIFDAISYEKYSVRMKNANEFFYLDSDYYFAGEVYIHETE